MPVRSHHIRGVHIIRGYRGAAEVTSPTTMLRGIRLGWLAFRRAVFLSLGMVAVMSQVLVSRRLDLSQAIALCGGPAELQGQQKQQRDDQPTFHFARV